MSANDKGADMSPSAKFWTSVVAAGVVGALVGGGVVWATQQQPPEKNTANSQQLDDMRTLIDQKDVLIAGLTEKYNAAVASDSVSPTVTPDATAASTSARQFAFVKDVTVSGGTYTVVADYAQFLTGTAAAASASAHGDESPPPNDYYIANDNKKLRKLPVKAGIKVTLTALDDGTSDPEGYKVSLSKWSGYYAAPTQDTGGITDGPYWITVTNGVITKIEEQYTP